MFLNSTYIRTKNGFLLVKELLEESQFVGNKFKSEMNKNCKRQVAIKSKYFKILKFQWNADINIRCHLTGMEDGWFLGALGLDIWYTCIYFLLMLKRIPIACEVLIEGGLFCSFEGFGWSFMWYFEQVRSFKSLLKFLQVKPRSYQPSDL